MEWVKGDREKDAFLRWIQHMVNLHESSDTGTASCSVCMTPPRQHSIEIVSTCTFHVEEIDDECDDGETAARIGCLELSGVQSRQRKVQSLGRRVKSSRSDGSVSSRTSQHHSLERRDVTPF